ncbi:MAG: cyclase family protein [Candidatus Hydrogenedentales bacterium]
MTRGACVEPKTQWLDVSMPLFEGMVCWPGDPKFELRAVSSLSKGDGSNVAWLGLSTHTGTHVDAPRHIVPDGARLDELNPSVFFGAARVLDLRAAGPRLQASDFGEAPLPARLLLKTANSMLVDRREFDPDFTALSPGAAARLVDEQVQLVGIDYLSIAPAGEDCEAVHRILLEAGVLIVEGLDLRGAVAGPCEFVVLPLAVRHGDGAPCRAFIRMEAGDG